MENFKKIIKYKVFSVFEFFRIFDFFLKLFRKNQAFILMYHRILRTLDDGNAYVQPGMYVLSNTFEQQMKVLRDRFKVISLKELLKRIKNGIDISGCCAITFDDGWIDNYVNAFPILKKYELPATIFLPTGFIGTKRSFWPEELSYILKQPEGLKAAKQNIDELEPLFRKFIINNNETEFLENSILKFKNLPQHKRELYLHKLRLSCKYSNSERLLMNWQEVSEMGASDLIDFGAHTDEHIILDQVSLSVAEIEIERSHRVFKQHLGKYPVYFAYPDGKFTNQLSSTLFRYHFKAAVTTQKKWVCQNIEAFKIPRIGVHEDVSCTKPLFLSRIFFDWL
jgi:peptidoglycan/xylan/chitin deacetylase (PgdA/CDA1 family)